MRLNFVVSGFVVAVHLFIFAGFAQAASSSQRLNIIYSSFTGAYSPLWIAVEEKLGQKHGLEIDSVYAGRARPHQLLLSGDAQYVVSTGTGVISSYAVGTKDLVIIASLLNSTGSSIYSKPQITKTADLRGKVVGSGRPGSITDVILSYTLKRRLSLEPGRDVKIVPLGDGTSILPALERGVVDAAMLTTPLRLMAKRGGYRELIDFDELGIQYPYVGISTLKGNVKKSPDVTLRLVRTITDAIHIFKTNKEKSLEVMKKYLRGANDDILNETYNYFSSRTQRYPYPSIEAIKTALEMQASQHPQARNVDPNEIADLSFVKQAESGASR